MNPDNLPLSPEAQAKVEELRAAGVIIPQLPYREDDFSSFGVERDVLLPADVAYTHRSGEEYEIYFVANQVDSLRTFNASFRIAGRTPELWNAVTGTITRPAQGKKRTAVPKSLCLCQPMALYLSYSPKNLQKFLRNGSKGNLYPYRSRNGQ